MKPNKERILEYELYDDYKEFCSHYNCINCLLVKEELIYTSYDQPCEEVYELLKIIQEGDE